MHTSPQIGRCGSLAVTQATRRDGGTGRALWCTGRSLWCKPLNTRTASTTLHPPLPRRQLPRRLQLCLKADAAVPAPTAQPVQGKGLRNWVLGAAALAALAVGGYALTSSSLAEPTAASVRHLLSTSVLAKSGFFAAFSLIFASEIGDKTFFIAALLAMRCGKWVCFFGSLAALSVMTVVSVGIGYAVKSVPAAVQSTEVLGHWLGAALLAYSGVRTLRDAWLQKEEGGDELGEAQVSVDEAAKGGAICAVTPWQGLLEVGTLIFVAEWGDRSMLATIALGAAQSPLGVAGGAVLGHALATAIAVVGGAVLSERISERSVGFIGGTLFLVFAAATMLGLF